MKEREMRRENVSLFSLFSFKLNVKHIVCFCKRRVFRVYQVDVHH